VAYEHDEVTRVIDDALDRDAYEEIANKTVSEFREWILDDETSAERVERAGHGSTGEIAAAVAKLSSNLDLITIGAKVRVVTRARTTIGLRGRL
jgi:ethanolamine ammonia-lyase large subunit